MKILLLVLCCLPATLLAKGIELGLYGGLNMHASPKFNNDIYVHSITRNDLSMIKGVKLISSSNKYDVALSIEMSSLKNKGYVPAPFENRTVPQKYNIVIARHSYAGIIAVNKKLVLTKHSLYGGVAAGMMFLAGDNAVTPKLDTTSKSLIFPNNASYIFGVQVGSNVKLSQKLELNIEAAARFSNFRIQVSPFAPVKYSVWSFPVLAGVKYKFKSKMKATKSLPIVK